MKNLLFISTFLLAVCQMAFSQESEWGDFEEINLPRMDKVSMDNQGFIFVTDLEGNLYQFNKSGKVINNFSPHRQGRISQLEAGWTINIFTFSIDLQEYRILDRFINPVADNRIPLNLITLAKAATLGNNNIIWVYDEADLSLKQFDYMRNQVVQQQPLNLILDRSSLDITEMREYQNLLFIHIKGEGIFILDNQGNLIKKIQANPSRNFGFWKNKTVFIENEKVISMDFQSEKKDTFLLSDDFKPSGVLLNQQIILLFDNTQIRIYQRKNTPLKGQ
ncbi:hypothetical protein [Aquiflexum gelatinilyticum]|uniref:Uncharacterized protein n=1 Tax=Aquiflexum gelatinilyticum TaxID=2961943 RepID=A0A9X2PEH7_9BACT|nr:hypothetical protein [Aquiflexum gelatinilyticum]MCR9017245.1 hypothetical protein [Aquiflexum gelatinilyticum]